MSRLHRKSWAASTPSLGALFLALAFFSLAAPPASAGQPSPAEAKKFIESLAARALQTLRGQGEALEQREAEVRSLMAEGFALNFIARFSLGQHWRTASKEQRADYEKAFREFFLRTYATRLGGYHGEKFFVDGAAPAGSEDVMVNSHIVPTDGQPIKAAWRVRMFDGKLKIIDIVVEGVSMALNQRQEFGSVVSRDGMAALLEMLRARAQRLPAQAPS